jgi:hypothetical protein
MVQYHEVLEVFAYEVNMVLETAEAETVNAAYAVSGECGCHREISLSGSVCSVIITNRGFSFRRCIQRAL